MGIRAALLAVVALKLIIANCQLCSEGMRLRLEGKIQNHLNGSISHNNVVYTNETFWKEGEDHYFCPCKDNKCIRVCKAELAETHNLTEAKEGVKMDLRHSFDETAKTVTVNIHFVVLKDKMKCLESSYMLNPAEDPRDEHRVNLNGTLTIRDDEEGERELGPESFCILATNEGNEAKVIICPLEMDDFPEATSDGMKYEIYPPFMLASSFFLFLLLLAFSVTPEMHNLQGKCIACQSGTLMIGFIALAVCYYTGGTSNIIVCKIFVYIAYTFILSSFFWLNTMCFDMYWTFSDFAKMSSSLTHTQIKEFVAYALYATCIPVAMSMIVILLDNFLNEDYAVWPGIGIKKAWFRDQITELMFFHGPLLLLVFANTIFFVVTLFKILKMTSDSRVLKRGDSMKHRAGKSANDDKQRVSLYLKLFILMGGTWFMELLTWAFDHETESLFSIIFDCFNCSRGVLIFIVCVVLNRKVRNSLLNRMGRKRVSRDASPASKTSKSTSFWDLQNSRMRASDSEDDTPL